MVGKNDFSFSWTIPVVTDNNFHVMFNDGTDFDSLSMRLKDSWKSTDKGVLLRFKRGKKTEAFETIVLKGSKTIKTFQTELKNMSKTIDHSTLKLGEGSFDNITNIYDLQLSGDLPSTGMIVTPMGCLKNCPDPSKECLVDNKIRKWSDVNNWPNKVLPKTGEDVEILCPWKMVVDIKETPILGILTINGELIFDGSLPSVNLRAKYIYVK
jgi:hypothetical protein